MSVFNTRPEDSILFISACLGKLLWEREEKKGTCTAFCSITIALNYADSSQSYDLDICFPLHAHSTAHVLTSISHDEQVYNATA